VTPPGRAGLSAPLTLDELWHIVQSKRGFESSPSPYKLDKDDELRMCPATISLDPDGRGAKLGHPDETFAALQIVDKDGRLVAVGSDYFDKDPLQDKIHPVRVKDSTKLDKHAEPRVLRALEEAVPGDVPDGILMGLVDQEVCSACRPKLEEFARKKKLR